MKVLITGTSQGIGKATAELFLEKGFEVIGFDIKIPTIKHKCYTHYIKDIRDEVMPIIWDLNYIINNAGVLEEELDPIGVNIYGTFNIEDHYVESNLKTLKGIVNVTSIACYDGQDKRAYTVSKGGLMSYTKHLANVLAPFKIRVNSVSPGAGKTEINERYLKEDETAQKIAEQNLMNRWGEASECAKAIYFMAVEATFTTGEDLLVDGGEWYHNRYIPSKDEKPEYE